MQQAHPVGFRVTQIADFASQRAIVSVLKVQPRRTKSNTLLVGATGPPVFTQSHTGAAAPNSDQMTKRLAGPPPASLRQLGTGIVNHQRSAQHEVAAPTPIATVDPGYCLQAKK